MRVSGGGGGEAAGFELAFESCAVGLGGAASEVFYVVGGHGTVRGTIHETIVAHARGPCPTGPFSSLPRSGKGPSGGGGGLLLREAFAAQDRAPLRGTEGNGGFLAALGAGGTSFHASVMASTSGAGR